MDILFEDDYIIGVNKPPMVLSQPSFNKDRKPIKDLVEDFRPDLKNNLYLHHRLDFETSGVFLMSKSKKANSPLTKMFQEHAFTKIYICLTRPNDLKAGKKVICTANNENEWLIQNHMAPAKDMVNHKRRMISVKSGGWKAETAFKIIKTTPLFHYIEAVPKTGRTHQIRQHLQESMRSILGDNIYGGKSSDVPRLMLHAHKLIFKHPLLDTTVEMIAPVPQDFITLLK